MSNNLANLMVGFGLDLSALQKDAPEAYRILNQQTLGMTAEMKRASREGAESFRLIDEALGIHVSRPLTRILTQEFPGLAKALQSVLGVGIVGALGVAAIEAIDKVVHKVEEARQAQEKYAESALKADVTVGDAIGGLQRKLAELGGEKTLKFKIEGAEQAERSIKEIGSAIDEEGKAAEKANSLTTRFFAVLGEGASHAAEGWAHILDFFGGEAFATIFNTKNLHDTLYDTQSVQNMRDAFKDMRTDLDLALDSDKLKGTHTALALLETDAKAAGGYLDDMKQSGDKAGQTMAALAQDFFNNALRAENLSIAIAKLTAAHEAEREAAARSAQAQKSIGTLFSDVFDAMGKVYSQSDPIRKISDDIEEMRHKAELAFIAVRNATNDPLQLKVARAELEAYNALLEQLKVSLESDVFHKQGDAAAQAFLRAPVVGTGPNVATTPAAPTLAAGGTTGAQFDAFSKDQAAQLKAAAAAYADLVTPQQKYQLTQRELNLLLQEGLIDQAAYTAALQKAGEGLMQAANHAHKMQEELQKLLERSTDARAGVQAFFLQLQINASENGKFAFDFLNSGLKGFEDELTKAVFTGKAHWKDLFRSMTEEAFKFLLNKEIAGMFQMLSGTGVGKSLGLSNLIPPAGGAGGAGLTAAAATLQTGSTTLMAAATTLQAAASSLVASGAGGAASGGGGDFLFSGIIPGYASGTDYAPGGLSWVGEQGPELLNLPRGSSVTPAGSSKQGGDTHVYIDQRGAMVTERMMSKEEFARSMRDMRPGMIGEAMANFSEIQKRTPQSR